MSTSGFLHQYSEFEQVAEFVATTQDVGLYLAEKAYWIMHGLYGLQQAGDDF